MFELGEESLEYSCLTDRYVRTETFGGTSVLVVEPEALELLAAEAFSDVAFFFRTAQLEAWHKILKDPEASENDKFVAAALLRNAVIAAEGVLPSCQDTGTATVIGFKGHRVMTDGSDERSLERGIARSWRERNLRCSQLAALTVYEEVNTGTNLPAQIDLYATPGQSYEFLFVAKGGGSSNKTFFFQETPALLRPEILEEYLAEKIAALGTAACPPYHVAVVVGGTSPERNLKTVKLATGGFLKHLPAGGSAAGRAFRDPDLEASLLRRCRTFGFGAQYGGTHFALSVTVVRLPRHAASLPIGIGVSCSADRNIRGRITSGGVFLERLEKNPARFHAELSKEGAVSIDTRAGLKAVRTALGRLTAGSLVTLTGPLVVARDKAHARIGELLGQGKPLPEYLKRYPVYYAGPAKTPEGMPSGSLGPTTSQRMDTYSEAFMAQGACLVTLGKGNRSEGFVQACKRYGGFYLGTIGGAAALLAKEHIRRSESIDFQELGMEAVRQIEVEDLPAFLVVDDKGNDLYRSKGFQAK